MSRCLPAVHHHCSHHSPVLFLGAAISRQLTACVPLLQGRVGAGADAVAKLAASFAVSCCTLANYCCCRSAEDSRGLLAGCFDSSNPSPIHTPQQNLTTYCTLEDGNSNTSIQSSPPPQLCSNPPGILCLSRWCRALTQSGQVAIPLLLKLAQTHTRTHLYIQTHTSHQSFASLWTRQMGSC